MSKIEGTKLIGMITPNGDSDNTFPTHEDIYGKGGYMVVTSRTGISADRVKKGMLVYDNTDEKIYKCIDAAKSDQEAGWEELKTTYDGGGKYLGTVSSLKDIINLSTADTVNIKAGDFYRVSKDFAFIDEEPAHTGDLIMAISGKGGGWDLLHTDQETLISIDSTGSGYVTSITNTGNAITVTKGTNIKVDEAAVANKLVGSVEEVKQNAKSSESLEDNDIFDTSLLSAYKIQLQHNYTDYSKWLYAPEGMWFGHVLNIGCGTGTLNAQFAWDTTTTAGKTGNLYWRVSDKYDGRGTYLKDSSINCNWKWVATTDMLSSNNVYQGSISQTKSGECFKTGFNSYSHETVTQEAEYKLFKKPYFKSGTDNNIAAIYVSVDTSFLKGYIGPITVSFIVKSNKALANSGTSSQHYLFISNGLLTKQIDVSANTDTLVQGTVNINSPFSATNFYVAFYSSCLDEDFELRVKQFKLSFSGTYTAWTPALGDYLEISTLKALSSKESDVSKKLDGTLAEVGANVKAEDSDTTYTLFDPNLMDPYKFHIMHNYTGYSKWQHMPSDAGYGHVINTGCYANSLASQIALTTEQNPAGKTGNMYWRMVDRANGESNLSDSSINYNWKRIPSADELDKWVLLGDFTLDYSDNLIANIYVDEFVKIPVTAGKYVLIWDNFTDSTLGAQVGGVVMEKGYSVPAPSMSMGTGETIDTSHVIDVVDPKTVFTINGNYDLYIMPVSDITNWDGNVITQSTNKFSISGLKIKKVGSTSLDFVESSLLKVDTYSEANSHQYPSLTCLENRLSGYKTGTLDKTYLPLTGGTLKGMLTIYNGTSSGNNFCVGYSSTSLSRNGVIIRGDSSELYAVKKGASTELKIQSNGGNTSFGGTISTAGNITVSTGGVFESSDIRKKNVISELPLEKCYDLLANCQEIVFTFKNSDKEQIGVIAQEVEKFFPEIIHIGGDGYKAVDYSKLSVICLRVLKDLITRLNKLENEREVK